MIILHLYFFYFCPKGPPVKFRQPHHLGGYRFQYTLLYKLRVTARLAVLVIGATQPRIRGVSPQVVNIFFATFPAYNTASERIVPVAARPFGFPPGAFCQNLPVGFTVKDTQMKQDATDTIGAVISQAM